MMERLRTAANNNAVLAWLGAAAMGLATYRIVAGWRARSAARARVAGLVRLRLLPAETSPMVMMAPPNAAVTFFRGSPLASELYLRARVREIARANPWLLSCLDKDPETGEVCAFYREEVASEDDGMGGLFCGVDGQDVALSRSATYAEMVKALAPVLCKPSVEVVGTRDLLFKVALVPDADAPNERFALVVSGNHTLMDGHDFYKIFNMLSVKASVVRLSPIRKPDVPDRILAAMGGEPSLMSQCPSGFLARFVIGQIRSAAFPRTASMGFDVDAEWLQAQKAKASTDPDNGVEWVSTNDCIVSAFLSCADPDVGMSQCNFRGRVEGCDEGDVGNYEDLITYMRGDYESPALIRKSVSMPTRRLWTKGADWYYRRAGTPRTAMLSNWKHLTGGMYAVATNWSTFKQALCLDNAAEEELHVPIFDFPKVNPACVLSSMAVFCPAAGRVAVLVAGTQALMEKVRESGMVGKPLGIDV